jgi:aminomethyltransferase
MGEFEISGLNSLEFVQHLCSNDISKIEVGKAQYNCLTNESGGIIDDLIVYRLDTDKLLLVVNASNISKNWKWITSINEKFNCSISDLSDDISLLAIQGPEAESLCQKYTEENLSTLKNYSFFIGEFAGIEDILISKTGYTGSGGYEIYIPNKKALIIWDTLFSNDKYDLRPIGLAARDTLRIEMGYCLYGNDINEDTSPIEANLRWITKTETNFIGSNNIEEQIKSGIKKKLIGFKLIQKSIPRNGYEIYNLEKELIGSVTSGTFSPILKIGIGLAYVDVKYLDDENIYIKIRDKFMKAIMANTPFI